MAPASLGLSIWAALLPCALSVRVGQRGPATEARTPVQEHGQLRTEKGRILDASGRPVRLRGMSLFWSQWGGEFYTAETVKWLAQDWNATVVRAAMGVEQEGYLGDPAEERRKVETVVQAAIDAGLYVVIDWQDHHAQQHMEMAMAFFDDMAKKYGGQANVLFEPFSEPEDQDWSTSIKPYHEALVKVIRKYTSNLVILGTPRWCQNVDVAAKDPVNGTNLAYALHFNVAAHGEWLRHKAAVATHKVPVFGSEWMMGDTTVNFKAAQEWTEFMANHSISDVNWAIFDGQGWASALTVPAKGAVEGQLQTAGLSASGGWVRASLRGEPPPPPPCEVCAGAGQDCRAVGCCQDPGHQCFEKDAFFSTCKETCTPGIDTSDAPEFRTSWSCKNLGGKCAVSCAATGANCKHSQCCLESGMQCFEKDEFFSACKTSCIPGVDHNDGAGYQTPWTCNVKSDTAVAETHLYSLEAS